MFLKISPDLTPLTEYACATPAISQDLTEIATAIQLGLGADRSGCIPAICEYGLEYLN